MTNVAVIVADALKPYATMFKGWQVKVLGEKPTAEHLAALHALGLRPGKQALANAMYLRDGGATSAQVVMACGAPQLNRMRALAASQYVKREATPANDAGHTVYKLTLTAKGLAKAAKVQTAAVTEGDAKPKAKKAKGASKAKKAKVTPVTPEPEAPAQTPVAEAPQVDAQS